MRPNRPQTTFLGVTIVGLLFSAPFAGCGGGEIDTDTGGAASTGDTPGSTASGSGGVGGKGGMGGSGGKGGSGGVGGSGGKGGSGGGEGGMGGAAGSGGVGGAGGMGSGGAGGKMDCVLDGVLTPPEECDDNNAVDGDGCDTDCTYSCTNPAADCVPAPACQAAVCAVNHTCATQPDPGANGTPCGANGTCKQGVCTPAVCGDGLVEGNEQCDFGAGNGPNKGCETTCVFSCGKMPDTCPDMNACNGVEVCSTVIVGGSTGQACLAGQPLADCSACAGGVCKGGACGASLCGDGCVDPGQGEQCEPPGSATCDATCKALVAAVCGNNVREGTEQCDDGNLQNLDACDAACAFEQDHRSNSLTLQSTTDAFCTANKFGMAITPLALGIVQGELTNGVAAGTSGFLFKALGLDNLTGANDPTLSLGVVSATPLINASYNGASDLDWWYTVSAASIDATRTPIDKIPASIAAGVLTAGPGSMSMAVNLFMGQTALLRLSNVKLSAPIGVSNNPLTSVGMPPGHLASEHLNPALTSFASLGSGMTPGRLCSNIGTKSLSQAPVPPQLQPGGQFPCTEGYTGANSLLDVLVSGCTIMVIPALVPSQPDQVDPSAPVAGGGGPYTFQVNAQKVVSGCLDKNNMAAPLSQCIDAAAYSSYFQFTTDRVILK